MFRLRIVSYGPNTEALESVTFFRDLMKGSPAWMSHPAEPCAHLTRQPLPLVAQNVVFKQLLHCHSGLGDLFCGTDIRANDLTVISVLEL